MEQTTYERPREKMRNRGVASLTNSELLQVIIGSGSVHMPVARIARKVSDLLFTKHTPVTYQQLARLKGLGDANTSRILASIQLATRLNTSENVTSFVFNTKAAALSKKQTVIYVTRDGSGKCIESYIEPIKHGSLSAPVARRVCARALADKASAISIAIGCQTQQLEPGLFELSFVEDMKNITALLQIRLMGIELVNKLDRAVIVKGSNL